MMATLVMTACSSDNDITEAPVAPSTSKIIPYTVTVGDNNKTTRATVAEDNSTLRFATGDKLYITGTDIQGVLDLQSGDDGKTTGATFSGELTYTGEGSPADNLELTATLVGTANKGVQITNGVVTNMTYPSTFYCASVNDAVQLYSNLTGTSTYGTKAFTLTQQTAILNFEITFEDGTTSGTNLSAVVSNGGSTICTTNVTTVSKDEKVVAKFVLPIAAGTTLSNATVTMGSKAAIAFGASQTLAGKVYNITRSAASEPASNIINLSTLTADCEAKDGAILTGTTSTYKVTIAAGATVTLDNATISSENDFCIKCEGDATIILKDGTENTLTSTANELSSTSGGYPALWVGDAGTTLTIQGNTGKLNVTSGDFCAGIGGGFYNTSRTCGNIRIEGGEITAQGGQGGAGIGADCVAFCGDITITGGTITVIGGDDAAGIGSGDGAEDSNSHLSRCGDILISGGTIIATGKGQAAGIGCGRGADCGTITITGDLTEVTATKGSAASDNTNSIGAGSGGCTCGTVTIDSSANVTQN